MLTNLINNAIRHNWEGGEVEIKLDASQFSISNTGPKFSGKPEELFQRFKKSNQSSTSMGLGLAIVKKVCDFYQSEVSYKAENEKHTIQIRFTPLKESK